MSTTGEGSLLQRCWRSGRATRLAVLVDGSDYFAAVREAMLQARHSIYVLGWDIDSRTRLVGEEIPPADGAPETLREFLQELVGQTPSLEVKLLLWDFAMIYGTERELLPQVALGWRTPKRVDICLDDQLPVGASHHHKLVVIDNQIAFIGGLDLTIRRWDTSAHTPDDSRRVDPDGEPYAPFHDLHAVIDGEPARAIAQFCRDRWARATGEELPVVRSETSAWPASVAPQFTDIDAGVARTIAACGDQAETREIEAVYLAAIEAAERFIYIENQYLTAACIVEALTSVLQKKPQLEALCVCPRAPGGWLEAKTMGAGRERFMAHIAEAGLDDRVRFAEPVITAGKEDLSVMVHSKLLIVDDRILLLGSANLNNRSLGLDTECNLVLDCDSEAHREALANLRQSLLAEHTGASATDVAEVLRGGDRLLDGLFKLSGPQRLLSAIEHKAELDDGVARSMAEFVDPESPLDPADYLGDSFGGQQLSLLRRRAIWIICGLLVLGAFLALWNYTPLSRLVDAELIADRLAGSRSDPGTALLILGLFAAGGMLFFPVTVLIAAAGIILGPSLGFATATAGVLLSATLSFFLGDRLENVLRTIVPKTARRKVRAVMKSRGIMAVAIIRNVPVAPFTAVNLLAAHAGIGLPSFLLGTLLGMAPGIAMLSIMGDRVRAIWTDPTPGNLGLLAAAIVAWVTIAFALQKLANRLKSGNNSED